MAYQTGGVTSIQNLANLFFTWVTTTIASPWTSGGASSLVNPAVIQLSKGGSEFVAMFFGDGENLTLTPLQQPVPLYGILAVPSTASNGLIAWYSQPGGAILASGGNPCGAGAFFGTGNITYHFFSDAGDDNIVIVAQNGSIYNFISFGKSLTKEGSWSGGFYVCGSLSAYNPSNNTTGLEIGMTLPPATPFYTTFGFSAAKKGAFIVRADVDHLGADWYCGGEPSDLATSRTIRCLKGFGAGVSALYGDATVRYNPPAGRLWVDSRSALANNLLLHYPACLIERSSGRFSILGYHPLIAQAFSRGELADGDEVMVSSRTFVVFGSYAVEKIP